MLLTILSIAALSLCFFMSGLLFVRDNKFLISLFFGSIGSLLFLNLPRLLVGLVSCVGEPTNLNSEKVYVVLNQTVVAEGNLVLIRDGVDVKDYHVVLVKEKLPDDAKFVRRQGNTLVLVAPFDELSPLSQPQEKTNPKNFER